MISIHRPPRCWDRCAPYRAAGFGPENTFDWIDFKSQNAAGDGNEVSKGTRWLQIFDTMHHLVIIAIIFSSILLQIWFLFNCSFINLIFFWMGGTKRKSISRLRKRRACHTAEASFFHILRFGNSIYTRNAILFLFKELTVWPNRQEVPLCPAFPWKFMCL